MPMHPGDAWSLGLRNEAYQWAKALDPPAPVLSCWDDSNNTDIVDHHDYGTTFTSWQHALYSDPKKGALVTEAGSRWCVSTQHTAADHWRSLTIAIGRPE
jgi:hypothetical protein